MLKKFLLIFIIGLPFLIGGNILQIKPCEEGDEECLDGPE